MLGPLLHRGGEGEIYEIKGHPDIVAKIYHKDRVITERIEKIKLMVQKVPENPTESSNHPSFTWPLDLVMDRGKIRGYIMRRISNMYPIYSLFGHKRRLFIMELSRFTYASLVRVAYNLAMVVDSLHKSGYVIGDINESNVLVNGRGLITIVDTDSFQVRDVRTGRFYACPVGKLEYTHPEILSALQEKGITFSRLVREPHHDVYALAVLTFQLLMEGNLPFAGVPPPGEEMDMSKRILNRIFPFDKENDSGWQAPPGAPPYHLIIPEELQHFFRSAFTEKGPVIWKHPTASQLANILARMQKNLYNGCNRNPNHYYINKISDCPWCKRKIYLGGQDPFPNYSTSRPSRR